MTQPLVQSEGTQGLLDALALSTMPVPVVGDVAGLASDAYRFATDPESRTLGNAAWASLGMLPFIPFAGIFAGKGAKTADAVKLAEAQKLEQAGAAARDIWNKTGWFKSPDGAWRFEIDDSGAMMRLHGPKFGTEEFTPLGETLLHSQAYKAYPDAKDINVMWPERYQKGGGEYRAVGPEEYMSLPQMVTNSEKRSTALHELQHAIQRREFFAKGGMPESAANEFYRQTNARMSELVRRMDKSKDAAERAALSDQYNALMQQKMQARPEDLYRRLAGEAEARAVQERAYMTPDERRETFPLDSYDMPLDQLIMRRL